MKKLIPFLLLSCVLLSCKEKLENPSVAQESVDLKSLEVGPNPIPLGLAKKMIENYANHSDGSSKNGKKVLGNTNIAPIWLELDNLAALIYSLKNENADGIRIYFGRFGNNAADEKLYQIDLEETDSYTNTMIITGTKDSLAKGLDNLKAHYHRDYLHNGAALGFINPTSTMSVLRPIPFNLAKYLVKNHEDNKEPVIDASGQQIASSNTRAIWFNLGKLESLVAKLKKEKADGVNIYFATYGNNTNDEKTYNAKLEKDYSYRNTVILIGTKEAVGTHTNGVKTKHHLDSFNNKETNGNSFTSFTGPVNNGEQCPVCCNGVTAF